MEEKVHNEGIVGKWKGECVGLDEKTFSEKMFDYVSYYLFLLSAKAILVGIDYD
jgi:hypothetical protein